MIFNRGATGQIFVCGDCQKIHLEFGNFAYNFSSEVHLSNLLTHLEQVDGDYFENQNQGSHYIRKIIVPIPETGFKILFTASELVEFRNLIHTFIGRSNKEMVSCRKIGLELTTFSPIQFN